MIEIRHLRKEYESVTPLMDVNAVIKDGDVISVIGPSGTGKSTLLRCINLLETPTSGDILLDGKNITSGEISPEEVRKKVGMVFQGFYLYPHLNVLENIMLPQMHILKRDKKTAYEKAVGLLKQVGLYDFAHAFPDTLSGGQKQRIAIARTLAMDSEVILFDEPTSALDPTMVDEVQYVIQQLAETTGKTILIVTHEMRFAREVSNRVFFMCDGEIYEDGTPEQVFEHPVRPKTIEFINRITRCEFTIRSKYFDFPATVRRLTDYAGRCRMSEKARLTMISVFEEAVSQILIPKMPDRFSMKVELTCSEDLAGGEFRIYMNSDGMILDKDNSLVDKLALDILRARSKELEIIHDETGSGFNSQMVVRF